MAKKKNLSRCDKEKRWLSNIVGYVAIGHRLRKLHKKSPSTIFAIGLGPGLGDFCYSMAFIDQLTASFSGMDFLFIISTKDSRFISLFPSIKNYILLPERLYSFFEKHFYYLVYLSKTKKYGTLVLLNPYFLEPNFSENRLLAESKQLGVSNDPLSYCFPVVNNFRIKTKAIRPYVIINEQSSSATLVKNVFPTIIALLRNKKINIVYNQPKNVDESPLTIEELFALSKNALAIISIRSGLLDFLISTNAPMVAIYPSNDFGRHLKQCYSLRDWGSNNEILEAFDTELSMDFLFSWLESKINKRQ